MHPFQIDRSPYSCTPIICRKGKAGSRRKWKLCQRKNETEKKFHPLYNFQHSPYAGKKGETALTSFYHRFPLVSILFSDFQFFSLRLRVTLPIKSYSHLHHCDISCYLLKANSHRITWRCLYRRCGPKSLWIHSFRHGPYFFSTCTHVYSQTAFCRAPFSSSSDFVSGFLTFTYIHSNIGSN